jgi:hypothetical protein
MKIYVGNLSYEVTEEDLRLALEKFGQVESATLIKDKRSGQSMPGRWSEQYSDCRHADSEKCTMRCSGSAEMT